MNVLERIYAALLRAYPKGFRDKVGPELMDGLRRGMLAAGAGRFRFGIREIGDLLVNLLPEWVATMPSGSVTRSRRSERERSILPHLVPDLRVAWRGLRRRPGFTVTVAAVLGLGIGTTTATFTVVNAVLLRPLPYPHSERLVRVWQTNPPWEEAPNPILRAMAHEMPLSWVTYQSWLEGNRSFDALGVFMSGRTLAVTGAGDPDMVTGVPVSSGIFTTLGVAAQLGRTLLPQDDEMGAPPRAVLSHRVWISRFGADPSVIGRPLTLNEIGHTIVGVMPPTFYFPSSSTDIWTSLEDRRKEPRSGAGQHFWAIGRLRSSQSIHRAQADMEGLAERIRESAPEHSYGVRLEDLRAHVVGDVRPVLGLLSAVVATVLLITCANIANLLLMRSAERRQELGIRSVLGAGRARIFTQLLTESALLAFVGGTVGLALAALGLERLVAWLPPELPRASEIHLDGSVLLMSGVVSLGTGLLMGVMPAFRGAGSRTAAAVSFSGSRVFGNRVESRMLGGIVIAEIALSVVLLVGAGLMVRSMVNLSRVELGFDSDQIVALRFDYFGAQYRSEAQALLLRDRLFMSLESLPGVEGVTGASWVPFVRQPWGGQVHFVGASGPRDVNVTWNRVDDQFFRALGIPMVAGRDFSPEDLIGPPRVAIISETMARRLWPDQDPIGERIGESNARGYTVIGVAADIRHPGFGADLTTDPRSLVYTPSIQSRVTALRVGGDPAAILRAAVHSVHELDPNLPVRTAVLTDAVSQSMANPRFRTWVVGLFAALAGLLAALGIYGVISYAVTQRGREIGIRLALGATTRIVLHGVVRRGLTLVVSGLAMGLAVVFAFSRAAPDLGGLLYQTDAADPISLGAVTSLVVLTGTVACLVPAMRATKIDPGRTLRGE